MFHTYDISRTFQELNSSVNGLTNQEALKRTKQIGPNELQEPPKDPWWKKFLAQFKDFLIIILMIAVFISAFLGEWVDALAIFTILILNAVLGFIQEYRAEKALEALKKMSASYTKVIRDGKVQKIAVQRLVPGDVFLLETGDKVPADARIIEAVNLKVSESILTGESEVLHKHIDVLGKEVEHLGEMRNLVFKDTAVMFGRGKAIAYATGMRTEVGKIARKLITTEVEPSPLTLEIDNTGKKIGITILLICILVFALGFIFQTASILETFLTSISLAVAAIPEGLPAIVTITLAMGTKRLAQQKAIMKKLHAVETLGSTTHICSDKTGTLTQNTMLVTDIWLANSQYTVTGERYNPQGIFLKEGKEVREIQDNEDLQTLLKIGALCNDAEVRLNTENQGWELIGDPTEGALITVALKAGLKLENMHNTYPRISEIPFSSEKAMMTTIHERDRKFIAYTKGAPEKILEKCQFIQVNKKVEKLTMTKKKEIEKEISKMNSRALRTLGFAYKKILLNQAKQPIEKESQIESNLVFVGLMGQKDPLRNEVPQAILECRQAGIRPMMITGDHYLTGYAIAKELGLIQSEKEVIDGVELVKLTDEELREKLRTTSVFARVLPKDKLRIIELLKKDPDKIVAVTGDGVNDSLAIKSADIGIAMGKEGTDVTREVADMILQDDNFATIVKAVRQGRVIYANLVKFIRYLISCNISEVLVVFLAVLVGFPIPLLPIQILWVNLITDGLPALALGVDPDEEGIMNRPPRNLSEGILSPRRWVEMILEGFIMCAGVFFVFIKVDRELGLEAARTAAFITLCITQLFHSLSNRSEIHSIFKIGIFTNKYLILAIVVSFMLQLLVVYTPIGNTIFKAVPLDFSEWGIIIGVSLVPLVVVEGIKVLKRKRVS